MLIPVVDSGDYVSTLDSHYYDGPGKPITDLIRKYSPDVYVEFHSYMREHFGMLTGTDRINQTGVPAYSVLERGVLLGSVSPNIRLNFPSKALCLSFEMEKANPISGQFALDMLDCVKECGDRDGFICVLRQKYPRQAQKAMDDYRAFYGL
jgi:hypothetical protein